MENITLPIRGYKVFNPDFTCRGQKFQVGETYTIEGPIEICRKGFHFCLNAAHCFSYYGFDSKNIVCEVEALGEVQTHSEDSKVCTDKIKIVRQLTWEEVLKVANQGKENTGHSNSGYSNSGNWNSGNRNSGDSNSGYRNVGAFCTDQNPTIWLFDKPTDIKVKDWERSDAVRTMENLLDTHLWIYSENMTDQEKEKFPSHKTTGGYLKKKTMHQAWADMWGNLSEDKRKLFTNLPNFDAKKFSEITGITI
jgi:hypothetical protein